ncbi:LOW QUALITY PROTEIN: hypothetical protein U9M48_039815 [Paspalum notatum var. saurae]|uniref:Integrase zinc-binding domain-containing protein n=1 Tax=Paspalum notatum var. saurae TaxID=547442 RepID=A0AAQ3UP33_PASNO
MPRSVRFVHYLRLAKRPISMKMSKEPYGTRTKSVCQQRDSIRKLILSEAHDTAYSIHPGSTKMYYDPKERFGGTRSLAEYVALCDTRRRVKAEHRDPQDCCVPLKIPEWKWEQISMDFIVGLPKTREDMTLSGGSQLTSRFWEQAHDSLDTKLRFGTAYHPRTDGRTERTNRVLEDMLRACAIQDGSGWDKMLPYASSLTTIATKPA